MKFIVDENLPPALSRWLIEWGHEAAHVHDLGLVQTLDINTARLAFERGEVIISKDKDFADLALIGQSQARLVWVWCGNLSLSALRLWFARRLPALLTQLGAGASIIELR